MHADKLGEFIAVRVSWKISCITGLEELVCLALRAQWQDDRTITRPPVQL